MPPNSTVSKRLVVLVVGLVSAIAFFGCGGGGGDGGTGSDGNDSGGVGVPTNIQAIAYFQGTDEPASPFVSSSTNYQLEPGDVVQIKLVGVNSITQQPQQVTATNFTSNAPSSVATLTSTGLLTAVAAAPGAQYTLGASYGGVAYTALFQVNPTSPKITGKVLDTSSDPIAGVVLNFYSSSGTLLAQSITGADGSFIGNVPSSAATFSVDPSALSNPGYFKEYGYGNFYYSTISTSCYSPLPTLSVGKPIALPNQIIVFPNNNPNDPPPPPTGCGQ